MTREEMIKELQNGQCTVIFEKKDKTLRTMHCTLKEGDFPPPETNPDKEKKKPNLEIVNVWDIDAEGWRAFRVDSVRKFNEKNIDSG